MKLNIVAHPNSKKPRIETKASILHVYVNEPATEGRANTSVILALSKHLNVPKSRIVLKSGQTAKSKIFEII